MSLIQAARKYAEMKKSGLTVEQISERTGVQQAAIRDRLQLLTLTPHRADRVRKHAKAGILFPLFERERQSAAPVRVLIDRRRHINLVEHADDILELHHHEGRLAAGNVPV